jgi:hypothetical protein
MAIELPNSGGPAGPQQPPEPPSGQGRIHVDSDWKRQAQADKERLDRESQQRPAAAGPAPGAPHAAPYEEEGLPPPTFAALVQTLATQAAIFMSQERDPETGQPIRNLELAKHNIDLLRVLEEKTKGNLSPEEKRLIETLLYELLMAYVSAAG